MTTMLSQIPVAVDISSVASLVGVTTGDKDTLVPLSLLPKGGASVDPFILALTANSSSGLYQPSFIDWTGVVKSASPAIATWGAYGSLVTFHTIGIFQVVVMARMESLDSYGAATAWKGLTSVNAGSRLYNASVLGGMGDQTVRHLGIATDVDTNSEIWTDTYIVEVTALGQSFNPEIHWEATGTTASRIKPTMLLTITQLKAGS